MLNIKIMNLKVGDKIICRRCCIMDGTKNDQRTTIGKSYSIIRFERERLCIIDDIWEEHWFPLKKFDFWFYTLKTLRRDKLKKIDKKYVRN